MLLAPGKLVNAPCDVEIEPRIGRGRVLDQTLDVLGGLLALSEHCLGAADRKVVNESRSRPIRLDKRSHSVQSLC